MTSLLNEIRQPVQTHRLAHPTISPYGVLNARQRRAFSLPFRTTANGGLAEVLGEARRTMLNLP